MQLYYIYCVIYGSQVPECRVAQIINNMKTVINVLIMILITLIKFILLPVIFLHEIIVFRFDLSCWACIVQNVYLCTFDKRQFDKEYFVFK